MYPVTGKLLVLMESQFPDLVVLSNTSEKSEGASGNTFTESNQLKIQIK